MSKGLSIPILAPHGRESSHRLGLMWLASLLAFVLAAFAQLVNEGLWRLAAAAAVVVAMMLLAAYRIGPTADA